MSERTLFRVLSLGCLLLLNATAFAQSKADEDAIHALLEAHTEKCILFTKKNEVWRVRALHNTRIL